MHVSRHSTRHTFSMRAILLLYVFILIIQLANSFGWFSGSSQVNNEELYKLLGVAKTATTKQIRVAFKKLALEKHPDKNQDDPGANDLFMRINRAYEILKDDELRKKYDTYGEEGLREENAQRGNNYQSWNFYQQNFGIYDEDPEIQTLSRSDFMQFVENNENTIWFINFYSTQCSHCYDLAPTWRELAKELDGVIKIGAVNCMDDWILCNEQQIQSFPSLVMYPKKQRFVEQKTFDNLLKFALSFASGYVHDLSSFEKYNAKLSKAAANHRPWLISYCLSTANSDSETNGDDSGAELTINHELNCLEDNVLQKLAIMLHRLVKVASINCNRRDARENLCPLLKPKLSSPLVLYLECLPNITRKEEYKQIEIVSTSQYKMIFETVLNYLPDIKEIDETELKEIMQNLRDRSKVERPWLIQFIDTNDFKLDLELKKMPALLKPDYNFARFDCSKLKNDLDICSRLQIVKYPTFVLFKSISFMTDAANLEMNENWYETYYASKLGPDNLASFVKENAYTRVRTLTDFDTAKMEHELKTQNKLAYFVDFFAPWCPPCMNLLPEFRKAAKLDASKHVLFATIDCTTNQKLCEQYNIRSYPTTILFNQSTPNNYMGHHSADGIADFIEDILKPSVVTLTYETFHEMVGSKPIGKIWLVDFYASWCEPCQQLAPEWRKLAKQVDKNVVQVGQVDCVIEQQLCAEQAVHSYPNIRLYPSEYEGSSNFDTFQGWMRDSHNLFLWLQNFMPTVAQKLDMSNFESLVLKNDGRPWMIDFYAPWCGHCQIFAPVFESLASRFDGIVNFGKVDCQQNQYLCQLAGVRAYPTIRFLKSFKSKNGDWKSGEDIEQYDFNSLFNTVQTKLNSYGYSNAKTEL